MVRPKKPEDKPKVEIDVEHFIRMRDAHVTSLTTLQDIIRNVRTDYIKQTNKLLGEDGATLDINTALSRIGDNLLLAPMPDLQPASTPAAVAAPADAAPDKKERKKRQHDPNAPKRPLTPFFLYMQTARPIIAGDLGPDVAKGAVSDEGTRRWKEMTLKDKTLWASAYKDNLRLYNARMHSYKAGNLQAKDMTEDEALQYAELHNIGADTTADAQLVGEAAAAPEDPDAEGEPEAESEPTPPPKTPKAKSSSRKAKKGKEDEVVEPPAPEPIRPAVAAPKEKKDTPVAGSSKRKRSKKEEPAVEVEEEETAKVTPVQAKPRPKKKAKADS